MSHHDDWLARCAREHAASVERGEHDAQCEYDPAGYLLCHCSKRRRVAAGFTEVPAEDLDFPPPDCPRCHKELSHDGDQWRCYGCSLSWASHGGADSASFTDSYGDDLTLDKRRWEENRRRLQERGATA